MTPYDYVVLTLQVSGFFGYLALRLLHVRGHWPDAAFSVHFVGDILFILKEKLMSELQKLEESFLSHVKLWPWAQFVGAMLAFLGLLVAAHNPDGYGFWFVAGNVGTAAGVAVSLSAFLFSVVGKQKLLTLKNLLQLGGLAAGVAGGILLSHGSFWSYTAFVGIAAAEAGQWYDQIYP